MGNGRGGEENVDFGALPAAVKCLWLCDDGCDDDDDYDVSNVSAVGKIRMLEIKIIREATTCVIGPSI